MNIAMIISTEEFTNVCTRKSTRAWLDALPKNSDQDLMYCLPTYFPSGLKANVLSAYLPILERIVGRRFCRKSYT
jgi:hypothetical protein